MDTDLTPYALGSENGEDLWFFGTLATFKATSEQTGGRFVLVEQIARKGMATPLHVQPQDDESFYVIEGDLTFYLEDGNPLPAPSGLSCTCPRELHTLSRSTQKGRGSST